jgi:putative membrane protein
MVYLETIPNFLMFFGAALVYAAAFLAIYTAVTPWNELALIRAGNNAAALSLGGAGLGFALPLAAATANSLNIADMAVWSAVALVIQLGVYFAARMLKPGLAADIEAGRTATAATYAAFALGVGLLNAACMT